MFTKLYLIFILIVLAAPKQGFAQSVQFVKLFGSTEDYAADVVREDNVNKLLVKSTTVPDTVSEFLFRKFTTSGGSSDMTINGSGTAVVFTVSADPAKKAVIREIKFTAFDGGIKIDTFLGQNSPLTTGIQVRLTIGGVAQDFFTY